MALAMALAGIEGTAATAAIHRTSDSAAAVDMVGIGLIVTTRDIVRDETVAKSAETMADVDQVLYPDRP